MTVPVWFVCWCFAPPKLDRFSRRRSSLWTVVPRVVLDYSSNLVTDVRTGYCETKDCWPCSSNSPVRTFECRNAISFLPRVTNTVVLSAAAAAWREHSSSSSSLRSSSFCWWIWIWSVTFSSLSFSSSSLLVPWMAS